MANDGCTLRRVTLKNFRHQIIALTYECALCNNSSANGSFDKSGRVAEAGNVLEKWGAQSGRDTRRGGFRDSIAGQQKRGGA